MEDNKQFIETLGAKSSDPDLRDYKIATASLMTEFPEEFELDLMPPVKNQGFVGSCVAHSIATVAEYYNKRQHDIDNELSVGYIYGNRVWPLNTTSGMITRFAISNFCADGTPYFSDFPLHCEVPAIIEEVARQKDSLHDKARLCRFTSYVNVSTEQEMKTALMDGNPIIIAVDWYANTKVKNGKVQSDRKEKTGGHAMVIYGWDKDGWKIQNSWGIFWGDGGKAIWPYEYKIRESYAIIDTEDTHLDIDKPFSTDSKFGKWCIRVLNKIYSIIYSIHYKLKH